MPTAFGLNPAQQGAKRGGIYFFRNNPLFYFFPFWLKQPQNL